MYVSSTRHESFGVWMPDSTPLFEVSDMDLDNTCNYKFEGYGWSSLRFTYPDSQNELNAIEGLDLVSYQVPS